MAPTSRAASRPRTWQPDSGRAGGPQAQFLTELGHVFEVLNAGEVGSGKTDVGLMAAVAYEDYRSPNYKALILRHNAADLPKEIYQRVSRPGMYDAWARGGPLNETQGVWRTRWGGRIVFAHAKNLAALHGPEFQYAYFDELPHWKGAGWREWLPAPEYLWVVMTRLRSAAGLPIRARAGANAKGIGKAWIRWRWGPWLSSKYFELPQDAPPWAVRQVESLRELGFGPRPGLPPCDSGQVLHFLPGAEGEIWCASGTPGSLSRSCLRTKTADNEALSAGDPAYADRLRGAGVVLHRQLARDDWDAEEEGGDLFRRAWFPIVSSVPRLDGVLRRWDLAYTAPDSAAARRKRDWTVGIKVGWTTGSGAERCFYVLNLVRTQGKPAEVRALIQQTAQVDGAIPVYVPVDYAAGAWVLSNVREALPQHDVREAKERGAKDVRIRGLQQHVGPPAEGGEPVCRVLLAPADGADWVEGFLDEAAAYPNGRWDDQLDALAGAVIASLEVGPSAEDIERDVKQAGAVARALGGGDEEFGWSWDEPLRVL